MGYDVFGLHVACAPDCELIEGGLFVKIEKYKRFQNMFAPGQSGNPAGKPAGVPNKATGRAREAIAQFVNDNADRLVGWLDRIAEDNPKAAFECYMSVVEYHIPKLARSEIENKMSISFEPLVIQRLSAEEPAPMIDVTPSQDGTISSIIEPETKVE